MDVIGDESLSPAGAASPQPTDEMAELRDCRTESPFPGYCFRHYQFGREVGRGNFATVYLARHVIAKVVVAIKVVDKASLTEDNSRKVASELQVMKSVHHAHIIKLYEIIETDRHVFIVTEFARNGELYDFLIRRGRLDEDDARIFFQQISSAIMYCHAKSIVHRDIKTENILLNKNNEVKLIDFGFSVFQEPEELLSTWCGSPPYAAPELLIGKEYDGFKADVWSLGVVLYILVTGGFPFPGRSMTKLKKAIFNTPLRIPFWVSVECSDLIRRMLVVDPNKRISMSAVLQHKWFVTRMTNEMRSVLNKNVEPLSDDPVPVRLNPSVLVFMQQYTQWSEEAIYEEVVKRNYHSPIYATYCILQDKLTRSLSRQNLLSSNTGSPRRGSRGSILSGKVNIEPEPAISTIPTHHSAILMNPEYDSDEANVSDLDRDILETSPPAHIPPCFGLTLNIKEPILPNPHAYNFEVRRHTLCAPGPLPVIPDAHQPLWNPLFIAPYHADRVTAVAAFNQQQQQQHQPRLNDFPNISRLPIHEHHMMQPTNYERRASAGEAFFLPNGVGDLTQPPPHASPSVHRFSYPAQPPCSAHKLSVSPTGNIEEEGAQYLSRQGSSKRNTVHGTLGTGFLGGPLPSPINSARRSCHPYTKLTANERRSSWTSSSQLNNALINSQQQAQLELLYRQALASPIQQLQKEFQQLTASNSNSNEGSRRSLCKTPPANANCMPRISITDENNRCYPTTSTSIDPVTVFRYQVGLLTGHSETNMGAGEIQSESPSFGPRPATVIGFTTAPQDKQSPDANFSIMDFSPASNCCIKTVYFRRDVQSLFSQLTDLLTETLIDFEDKSYNSNSGSRGVRATCSDGTKFDVDLTNCLDSGRSQMRVLFVSGDLALYEVCYSTLLSHLETTGIPT